MYKETHVNKLFANSVQYPRNRKKCNNKKMRHILFFLNAISNYIQLFTKVPEGTKNLKGVDESDFCIILVPWTKKALK